MAALGESRQVFADMHARVRVAIGLNSPRMLSGALGLRSKLSSWDSPPERKM